MAKSFWNIVGDKHVHESFDFLFIHALAQILFRRRRLSCALGELSAQHRYAHSQTLAWEPKKCF